MNEKNWLSYYKKSLSDSLKSDVDTTQCEHFIAPRFEISSNLTSKIQEVNRLIDIEEVRINKTKGITIKTSPEWKHIDSAQLLISPFYLNPVPEHQVLTGDSSTKRPFWFYVIADRQGRFFTPNEQFPIAQRRYLEPLADEKTVFIFSTMEKVDNATSIGIIDDINYGQYIDYVNSVFKFVTDYSIEGYQTIGHSTIFDALILLPDEEIGASKAIIELYHRILQEKKQAGLATPLLSHFINIQNPTNKEPVSVENFIYHNATHLGQMGFEFPISISQRKALYTLNSQEQKVFAINGPPGTGKTTLLQTIVANEMVKSAIAGNKPSIILACSNNNQAVTNIIDSFSKSNTQKGNLQGRWLPDISGYATYLPALSRTNTELEGINYKKLDRSGLFSRIENDFYLTKAKQHFLDKAVKCINIKREVITVEKTIEILRNTIISIQKQLEDAPKKWHSYLDAEAAFLEYYINDKIDKKNYYENNTLSTSVLQIDIDALKIVEITVNQYFDNEPFFRKLFCWLGFSSPHKSRYAQIKILLRDTIIDDNKLPLKCNRSNILEMIDKKISMAKKTIKNILFWIDWKKTNNIKGNPPKTESEYWLYENRKIEQNEPPNCFYDELDVTLRHRAFQLALHYWEGRWLIETEYTEDGKRGKDATERRWLRHAMLTPCFVSTFYMAPKFFAYSRHLGTDDRNNAIWGDGSLYNFVDILVVDEAGQVAPEVGIATFALAKNAIIVGDVLQIEPIWNIEKQIDKGNLKKCDVIKSYDDSRFEEIFGVKGFLSSSGSIMKMAQNACDYKESNLQVKGLMLLEHRRCYNEIIKYCNRLAYNGLLKPLKGNAPKNNLFKPMILIDIQGSSTIINNSRRNEKEADAIVQWLLKNKADIINRYGNIEENVGIITPFVSQKFLLKQKLRQAGFNTDVLKYGTVHALQGAERPIILFSMVYGPNEVNTMFFDRTPNMLNVAVSRAKDSFFVFANKEILNSKANTPSGLLMKFLK